ncbi:YfhE family protein [Scopulibacillus cellulosilyticus]|uniref:YfhE family protein n=1 Tax=Scopulibacillus cellulosilyticus TaxID=2665665 RepID=A0ABW2PX74_9BACL
MGSKRDNHTINRFDHLNKTQSVLYQKEFKRADSAYQKGRKS